MPVTPQRNVKGTEANDTPPPTASLSIPTSTALVQALGHLRMIRPFNTTSYTLPLTWHTTGSMCLKYSFWDTTSMFKNHKLLPLAFKVLNS